MQIIHLSFAESKSCNVLEEPKNGRVEYSSPHLVFGTEAEYHCNVAYSLVGEKTRTCQAGGVWKSFQPDCGKLEYID